MRRAERGARRGDRHDRAAGEARSLPAAHAVAALAFAPGETVVCPGRGVGTVTHVGPRELLGRRRHYLTIELSDPELTIALPDEALLSVGIRRPVSRRTLQEALRVLATTPEELPVAWRERESLNQAKLAGGDVAEAAEVVRDLSARSLDRKQLCGHDKEILTRAKHLLASELAAAFTLSAETAAARVATALAEPSPGSVG